MNFTDKQLEKYLEDIMSSPVEKLSSERSPVFALMAAYDWFRGLEGVQSSKVAEIVEHLLSPALRPALRDWYHQFGECMNPAAMEFRDHLSTLAGEKFG